LPVEIKVAIIGAGQGIDLAQSVPVFAAIRSRTKVRVVYADGDGKATERVVWPFLIAYLEDVRVVAAWCELREAFRHFRTDRIRAASPLSECYPGGRDVLLRRWEAVYQKN